MITYRIQIGVNAPDEYAWKPEGFVYAAANGHNGFEGSFVFRPNCPQRMRCVVSGEIERTSRDKATVKNISSSEPDDPARVSVHRTVRNSRDQLSFHESNGS